MPARRATSTASAFPAGCWRRRPADQVRCLLNTVCLDYSSTRGLSPSRCWLVLRQHRSEPQGSDLNCDPPVSFPASGLLRCWPPSFRGVMLVAGGDPGFWHGPWPYLPGCAGEDHCRRQVPLYVLSHHHCAFTNKEGCSRPLVHNLLPGLASSQARPPTKQPCFLERAVGIEPTTSALEGRCSTAELHPHRAPDSGRSLHLHLFSGIAR